MGPWLRSRNNIVILDHIGLFIYIDASSDFYQLMSTSFIIQTFNKIGIIISLMMISCWRILSMREPTNTPFHLHSKTCMHIVVCRNPTLAKCGGEAQHSQSWEFGVLQDSRMFRVWQQGPDASHWGVLGVIGKVFKRRYRKWPRIDHLDICSPGYGQKKGRESNWH